MHGSRWISVREPYSAWTEKNACTPCGGWIRRPHAAN